MRRLSANYIFPVSQPPLKNGIVEIEGKKIVNIIDTGGNLTESRNLEFYNGVITPGLINTHCHLELSELNGQLNSGVSLPGFISQLIGYKRNVNADTAIAAAKFQDDLMQQNGIVAVGDIVNSPLTIDIKTKSKIYYHSFIELIGLGNNSNEIFKQGIELNNRILNSGLSSSIAPHAPYSVSEKLFHKVIQYSEGQNSILTIHNQESEDENEMYRTGKGQLAEFFDNIGIDLSNWNPTGKNSIEYLLQNFPKSNNILFVHNLYSSKEEIERVGHEFKNAYFVLCPLSNYFIENKYPEIDNFISFPERITLGTDSMASNRILSIIEEMKILGKLNSKLSFDILLQWATLNGAKSLKIQEKYGSLDVGKEPGINLITDFDFTRMQLSEKSKVKVLV